MNITLTEKIKEHISKSLNKKATALAFAIMHNGVLETEGALGTTDGNKANPASPRDLYNVGSISKIYCTVAVMLLVERGLLNLDDPVCNYLPRFRMPDPRYRDITIRMALSHSSGLPGTCWKDSFSHDWIDGFYDTFYDYLEHSYLKADPGRYSVYCNDGFTLAEILVAETSKMSFQDFVSTYITGPLGAVSSCFSDKLPEGIKHVEMPGKGVESLQILGSGGLNTDMYDCAKFANMFLTNSFILSENSKAEMAKRHGATFIGPDRYTEHGYGLGWDTVSMKNLKYDFGAKTTTKGGGTLQFLSHMIVSPEYGIAAAASCTYDCDVTVSALLYDAIAMLLETKGIQTKREPAPPIIPAKIPVEQFTQYAGKYISQNGLAEISYSDTDMILNEYSLSGERSAEDHPPLKYSDGKYFDKDGLTYEFAQAEGRTYLMIPRYGCVGVPTYMKVAGSYPEVDPAWLERVGRKYIACNTDAHDLGAYCFAFAFEIKTVDFIPGMLFISGIPDIKSKSACDLAFLTMDAQTGKQFLDAPHTGSRDTFAPLAYTRDGLGYIYCCGIEYMELEAAAALTAGSYTISSIGKNLVFKIEEGVTPEVTAPTDARYLVFNTDVRLIFDSLTDEEYEEGPGGYLVLIGKEGDVFDVNLLPYGLHY